MKIILLSGGSGQRLWPLSNNSRSKQFLKVLNNGKENESMVQRVWTQLKKVNLSCETFISTSSSQIEMIKSQVVDDVKLIVEPFRMDTFPAIALACSYLNSVEEVNPNEVVTVLPVDPFVEDAFFEKIQELEKVLSERNVDLALIGVKPTYSSSKYGYIIPDSDSQINGASKVEYFVEKPNENLAESLISKGALWNCGVFSFKLKYMLDLMAKQGIPEDYYILSNEYSTLPKNSFDYEVVEKEKNISVVPYDGYWKDLGTWNTLTDEMSENKIGLGTIYKDCQSTHLINELSIPINVIGLDNVVVAASPDGILVSDKSASPKIKDIIKNHTRNPMFEEKRWGWAKVLDLTNSDDGNDFITKKVKIYKDENISYHYHNNRRESWTIIRGNGEVMINGILKSVSTGDSVVIEPGDVHSIKALSDLQIIEFQSGVVIKDDIFRIEYSWDSILDLSSEVIKR
ncbi:sugar phosphate nucleotidyltransferase [Rossellomorea marisflavi]|uniref:sugar phosphate nucleotidyltransferase n=1 Tax=Rossellomorea marisflavi TaxID=189381 RepID=UPI003D2EDB46